MRLCANLGFLFTEQPFMERFAAAAAAGFSGVEFMSPEDHDVDAIAAALARHRLELVLFNLPAGDWASGERGIASLPGREDEFRAGVDRARQLAKKLGVRRLNALAGLRPGAPDDDSHDVALAGTLVENLRFAAEHLAADGIRLLVEPINSRIDMPGFWLDTPAKAMQIIERVNHQNLGLQFDVYHAQVMTGDLARQLEGLLPVIGHIQIADHPGRHQPGTGEINYAYLLARLDALKYSGWVGCEYRPRGDSVASLQWATRWLSGTATGGSAGPA